MLSLPYINVDEHSESSGIWLLVRLIDYWLEEIKARGWTIHGLLNGSIGLDYIDEEFSHIDDITYPMRFGQIDEE